MAFRRREALTWLLAAAMLLTIAGRSRGEVLERAAALYERGIECLELGRYEEAAEHFAQAYAERPEYSVLYNLGQAQLALSRPVEGVAALRRYLAEGGAEIPPERVREVERALAVHEQRIAHVTFELEPADAEIVIDGRPLAGAAAPQLIPLGNGTHGVVVRKAGYESHASTLRLRGGEQLKVSVRLERTPAVSAALLVSCAVPDVRVILDGQLVASTPVPMPLVVSAGRRHVRFERAGYEPRERVWELGAGTGQNVDCAIEPLAASSATSRGTLVVTSNVRRTRLWVDGERYDGAPIPSGAHLLRVEAIGYRPHTARVMVPPAAARFLAVQLEPLAGYEAAVARSRRLDEEAAGGRQVLAALMGGTGIAVGATAIALAVAASDSYAEWERTQGALGAERDAERRQVLRKRSNQLVTEVNRLERWAVGLGAAGGLLAAGGLAWWVLTPSGEASTPDLSLDLGLGAVSFDVQGVW